jgi:hypothetical protein
MQLHVAEIFLDRRPLARIAPPVGFRNWTLEMFLQDTLRQLALAVCCRPELRFRIPHGTNPPRTAPPAEGPEASFPQTEL